MYSLVIFFFVLSSFFWSFPDNLSERCMNRILGAVQALVVRAVSTVFPAKMAQKERLNKIGWVSRIKRMRAICKRLVPSLPYQRFPTCKNDCVVFAGSLASADHCPSCQTPRPDNDKNCAVIFSAGEQLKRLMCVEQYAEACSIAESQPNPTLSSISGKAAEFSMVTRRYDLLHELGLNDGEINFRHAQVHLTLDGHKISGKYARTTPKSVSVILAVNEQLPLCLRTNSKHLLLLAAFPSSIKSIQGVFQEIATEAVFQESLYNEKRS